MELYNQIIICGHKSGFLSFWEPTNGVYLQCKEQKQISDKAINKILLTKLSDNNFYLILCCSDKTVKIFSFERNDVIQLFNYDDEIMDITVANDYDNQSVFLISLKNGILKVFNNKFEFLFDITSRFNINKQRKLITMKNQFISQDNSKGDFVLITEGNLIDIYTWIKPDSFKPEFHNKKNNINNNNKMNNNMNNNNNNYNMYHQQYPNFHGPHSFPPHHFYRGGKY